MATNNVHIIKEHNRWTVRLEKDPVPQKVASTQKEAVRLGREIARNKKLELIILAGMEELRKKTLTGTIPVV